MEVANYSTPLPWLTFDADFAFAPDDECVDAGTQGGNVRVIRTADKTELPALSTHPGGVTAVSVGRDGTLLATGGRDRTVRLGKRAGDTFGIKDQQNPAAGEYALTRTAPQYR